MEVDGGGGGAAARLGATAPAGSAPTARRRPSRARAAAPPAGWRRLQAAASRPAAAPAEAARGAALVGIVQEAEAGGGRRVEAEAVVAAAAAHAVAPAVARRAEEVVERRLEGGGRSEQRGFIRRLARRRLLRALRHLLEPSLLVLERRFRLGLRGCTLGCRLLHRLFDSDGLLRRRRLHAAAAAAELLRARRRHRRRRRLPLGGASVVGDELASVNAFPWSRRRSRPSPRCMPPKSAAACSTGGQKAPTPHEWRYRQPRVRQSSPHRHHVPAYRLRIRSASAASGVPSFGCSFAAVAEGARAGDPLQVQRSVGCSRREGRRRRLRLLGGWR